MKSLNLMIIASLFYFYSSLVFSQALPDYEDHILLNNQASSQLSNANKSNVTYMFPTYDCGNGAIYSFLPDGNLLQDNTIIGDWDIYLGNGLGQKTPVASYGYTYVEFNNSKYTVIEDTLLEEYARWSCVSVHRNGPLLPKLAPLPN